MILVSQEELQKAELKNIDGKTYMVFGELQNAKRISWWIPTKVALPKDNELDGDTWKYYLVQDEFGDMHIAHFEDGEWFSVEKSLDPFEEDIVAWQELPERYKAESEEKGKW